MASQDATNGNKPVRKAVKKKAKKKTAKIDTKAGDLTELLPGTPGAAVVSTVDMTFGFPGKLPSNIRHAQFIQAYVKHGEIAAAAQDSGYSHAWARAHGPGVIKDYHDYVAWLQAHKAQQLVRVTGIEQSIVVEEVAKIAFANDYDYHVFELVEGKSKKGPARTARRKRVDELTRDQLTAVEVYEVPGRGLHWKFRDRDQALTNLGKHLGMYNEKIIMEHRHRHLHAQVDLTKVDGKQLEALEAQFEVLLGVGDATK